MKWTSKWLAVGCVALLIFGLGVILWLVDSIKLLVSAAAVLAAGAGSWWLQIRKQAQEHDRAKQLDQAAEQLADALQKQCSTAYENRQLHNVHPLQVQWSATDRRVSDSLKTILGPESTFVDERWAQQFYLSGGLDEVARAFERLPKRRLVILGEPGAGKTIVALTLALKLLEQRQSHEPIPVLLSIGSWNPKRQHLRKWISGQLIETYQYQALRISVAPGSSAADELVRKGRILPILDGLDEMPERLRPDAISEINRILGIDDSLVLTCRSAEYEEAVGAGNKKKQETGTERGQILLVNTAVVELQPLSVDEIGAICQMPTDIRETSGTRCSLNYEAYRKLSLKK